MNERMLKLYRQAQVPGIAIDPSNNLHYETTEFSAEKFAELIVRECAEVAGCNFHVSGFELGDLMKQHFGVEE